MSNKMYLKPNAAGSLQQHTAVGAAARFECVNDASPDGDVTYVVSLVPGGSGIVIRVDTYAYQNPPSGKKGAINYVKIWTTGRYQLVGLQNKIKPVIRIGTINYSSTNPPPEGEQNLPLAYPVPPKADHWDLNPATGLAWGWPALINIQAGYVTTVEDSGADADARITDQYMEIDFDYVFDPGDAAHATMQAVQPAFLQDEYYIPPGPALAIMEALQPDFIQQTSYIVLVYDRRDMQRYLEDL